MLSRFESGQWQNSQFDEGATLVDGAKSGDFYIDILSRVPYWGRSYL